MNLEYSVVIPAFNEQDSLVILQDKIVKIMDALGRPYEIIYINDASVDETSVVLKDIGKTGVNVRVFTHPRRLGQSAALYTGFKAARGEWVITLDADLQNNPSDIKKLTRYLRSGKWDLVQGVRKNRKDSFARKASSRVAFFFRKIVLGDNTIDVGCSLRVFRRKCINDNFLFFRNFHRFFPYLLHMRGCKVLQVKVSHNSRLYGSSKYGNIKRAIEGVFDLVGVFWLKKRMLRDL